MDPLTIIIIIYFILFGKYMICLIPRYPSFQNWSKSEFWAFLSVKYLFSKVWTKNLASPFLIRNLKKKDILR